MKLYFYIKQAIYYYLLKRVKSAKHVDYLEKLHEELEILEEMIFKTSNKHF